MLHDFLVKHLADGGSCLQVHKTAGAVGEKPAAAVGDASKVWQ